MEILRMNITGAQGRITCGVLTAGMVGVEAAFQFDGAWEGLRRRAIFRAGSRCRTVSLEADRCAVPWEVLAVPNLILEVGVYGVNDSGSLAIPTVWAQSGIIQPGADPNADPALEPESPMWQQALSAVEALRQDTAQLSQQHRQDTARLEQAIESVDGGVLQPATGSTLGGVMVGDGLQVEEDGLLTAVKAPMRWTLLATLTVTPEDGVNSFLITADSDGSPFLYDELMLHGDTVAGTVSSEAGLWINREAPYQNKVAKISGYFIPNAQGGRMIYLKLLRAEPTGYNGMHRDVYFLGTENVNSRTGVYKLYSDGAQEGFHSLGLRASDTNCAISGTWKLYGRKAV